VLFAGTFTEVMCIPSNILQALSRTSNCVDIADYKYIKRQVTTQRDVGDEAVYHSAVN
jgi:hypothetical protein